MPGRSTKADPLFPHRSKSVAEASSRSHDRIPTHLSRPIYRRALELAEDGLGSVRIARELSRLYPLRIAPGTIAHWIAHNRSPRLRNLLDGLPSPSLSYVIGAAKGDGCSLSKSGLVKLEVTDRDFAEAFNRAMARIFDRESPNKILTRRFHGERRTLYIVKYMSRELVSC